MRSIEGTSIGVVWVKYLECILKNGHEFHDEDEQIVELEDIVLTIQDDIALESGVLYKIIKKGNGAIAKSTDKVKASPDRVAPALKKAA